MSPSQSVASGCPFRQLLLAVSDEALAARLIPKLVESKYWVYWAADAATARAWAKLNTPQLVLIEMDLPPRGACALCRQFRNGFRKGRSAILALCADGSDVEKGRALAAGADDVVSKSVNADILLERLQALERRRARSHVELPEESVISRGGVTIDLVEHRASLNGSPLALTMAEWRILCELVRRAGGLLTPSESTYLSHEDGGGVRRRTLDFHIKNLRRKLGGYRFLIERVPRMGYRFRQPTEVEIV